MGGFGRKDDTRGLVDGSLKREKGGVFLKGVWKGLVLFCFVLLFFIYESERF